MAKQIREISSRKIAYIEQDNIRRTILKEKETDDGVNIKLISQIVEFSLEHGYDVLLEGMLNYNRYGEMLEKLIRKTSETYIYYFDVSFEETLRRHATKPIANDVSESDLRQCFKPGDRYGHPNEIIIPESFSATQAAQLILETSELSSINRA